MKRFLIAPAFILIAAIAGAQGSDTCAGATVIPAPGVYPGTNVGATNSGISGTCTAAGLDVWFTYTVAASLNGTRVIAATCPPGSATFNSAVDIFTGTCGAIATSTCGVSWCNFPGGSGSRALTGPLAVGTVVLIRVRGVAAETGTFELYVDQTFDTPFLNGTCAQAFTLFDGLSQTYDNISESAGVQAGFSAPACGNGSRDVFFTYAATGTGNTTVRTCFPEGPVPALGIADSLIAVFESCGGGTAIVCDDDGCAGIPGLGGNMSFVTFPTVTGTSYVIRVSGFASINEGQFRLEVIPPGTQFMTNITPAVIGFLDISATGGTPIIGVSDDSEHNIVTTIGNAMFPAGNVRISENGVAIAGTTTGDVIYINQSIPGTGIPSLLPQFGTAYLLPFWDDLLRVTGNQDTTIWWQELGGVLFIMWKDLSVWPVGFSPPTTELITFEVQVFGNPGCGPAIQFLYPDSVFGGVSSSHDNGDSATVGYLSQLIGVANAQFSFNDPDVPTGTVISFSLPGATLAASSPLAPGSLKVTFGSSACSNNVLDSYVLAVTVNTLGWTGSLPLFGLNVPIVELLGELAIGFPYVGDLVAGGFSYGPFGGLPPFTFSAVVVGFDVNGVLAGHSNVITYTIP